VAKKKKPLLLLLRLPLQPPLLLLKLLPPRPPLLLLPLLPLPKLLPLQQLPPLPLLPPSKNPKKRSSDRLIGVQLNKKAAACSGFFHGGVG
jgi:hypothetical protein